jgi:transposase
MRAKPAWRKTSASVLNLFTATAADLVFEAGEFSRFRNARSFAAWVGLTPSEHSSGESDRRGAITKAGNKHLRKTLVEAAWHT